MRHSTAEMIGRLVRWENDGRWFTARVTGHGKFRYDAWSGEVVDPGNYVWSAPHPYFVEAPPLVVGQVLPNLLFQFLTVVDESSVERAQ
jgi:hypothetical protein